MTLSISLENDTFTNEVKIGGLSSIYKKNDRVLINSSEYYLFCQKLSKI